MHVCDPSLQLQAQEPIPETATYGALRPYRESPLLARARRTESFHSYRDFQSFSLGRGLLEGPSPGPGPTPDARRSLCEFGGEEAERRGSVMELWASRTAYANASAVASAAVAATVPPATVVTPEGVQIGRASCRERVSSPV